MNRADCDVAVVGGGPAGLAAAAASADGGARTVLLERDEYLGGILRQCVHDGFGLEYYRERLTGPEYAVRWMDEVRRRHITVRTEAFVHGIHPDGDGWSVEVIHPEEGVLTLKAKALVMATGCRERTDRQVFLQGSRPAGLFTAGQAQRLINIDGYLPGRRCVILGSGDIGLIMARRLTLEGAAVEGVYEIRGAASGLERNVIQCLTDYGIPLNLNHTVAAVRGRQRVEGLTVAVVDDNGKVLPGTERDVACDTLILSVGLIPENDLLVPLDLPFDPGGGPPADQDGQTLRPGLFTCGNARQVSDLVDWVTLSGSAAGRGAAAYADGARRNHWISVRPVDGGPLLSPGGINPEGGADVSFTFRPRTGAGRADWSLEGGGRTWVTQPLEDLKPAAMKRIRWTLPDNAVWPEAFTARLEEAAG